MADETRDEIAKLIEQLEVFTGPQSEEQTILNALNFRLKHRADF